MFNTDTWSPEAGSNHNINASNTLSLADLFVKQMRTFCFVMCHAVDEQTFGVAIELAADMAPWMRRAAQVLDLDLDLDLDAAPMTAHPVVVASYRMAATVESLVHDDTVEFPPTLSICRRQLATLIESAEVAEFLADHGLRDDSAIALDDIYAVGTGDIEPWEFR